MIAPRLSERALVTPPSPIRRLAHLSAAARNSGTRIYHLNIGQPDIESPTEFFTGLQTFKGKVVHYENSLGNERLRSSWSNYVNCVLGLKTKADEYLITTGASEALIFAFTAACDPGDEIIVFDPTYANYIGFASLDGVKLIPVPCSLTDNFELPSAPIIEKKIGPRTKAILLCNPNNPTGTVYGKAELEMLLSLCEKHNLFFIVDETYREFVYDGIRPLSIFHLSADNPRVIVIDSLSKRFSLCGARLGCMITSNKEVQATALNMAQARLASPTLEQCAAAYMLDNIGNSYLADTVATYSARRDILHAELEKISGVTAHKPFGAFYMIARLPVDDAEKFATFLLTSFSHNSSSVFLAPARGFYMDTGGGRGMSEVRVAYVLKEDDIIKSMEIVRLGLEKFKNVADI